MTTDEFFEMVEWIIDRWGRNDDVWANANRFAIDFTDIDATHVWGSLNNHCLNPDKAAWPPRPAALRAAALDHARHQPAHQDALPDMATGPAYGLRQWITDTYGDPDLTIADVIRQRHADLEGQPATETEARTADEDAWIRDGHVPTIECLSPHCDIHREHPIDLDAVLADEPDEILPADVTPELVTAGSRDEAPW